MAHLSAENVLRLHVSPIWENHPHYGIVHPAGCSMCDGYRAHLNKAAFDCEPSFQKAREDARRQSAGVIGEQRGDVSVHRAELKEAREEIARLRTELRSSQMECERLRQFEESHRALSKGPEKDVGGDYESKTLVQQSRRSSSPAESSMSGSFATPSAMTDALSEPSTSPGGAAAVSERPTFSSAVIASGPRSSYDSQLPEARAWRPPSPLSPGGNTRSNSTAPVATLSPVAAPSAWQVAGSRAIRSPRNMKQMNKLLEEANKPNNVDYYRKVKELCAEAHAAKDQKTGLQKYLLVKWKTPEWVKGPRATNSIVASDPPTNPLHDDPPEAWVAYYAIYPASWPLGVRKDIDGKPLLSDMRASRIMARLRPDMVIDEPTTRAARLQFREIAIRLFSASRTSPDTYSRVLSRNSATIAPQVSYQPFSGTLEEITIDNIAVHFAQCGISATTAANELGPWAQECSRVWEAKKELSIHTV